MAKIKCENCGAKYNGNFCPICSTPAPEQPQKKKKKWVLPVIIVVVLVLLVSCIAGGGEDVKQPSSTTSGNNSSQAAPSKNSTTKTEKAPAAQTVSISEQELYNKNGIVVTAKKMQDGLFGPEISVTVENNSTQNIVVSSRSLSVNDFMLSTSGLYSDVAVGKKDNAEINLMSSELRESGISTIGEIAFYLNISSSDTYNTIDTTDLITIQTSAAGSLTQEVDDSGDEVYSGNNLRVVCKGLKKDSIWDGTVVFYLDYIYVNQIGEIVKPGFVTAHFSAVLKANNLPHIRFHDLRHPYVKPTTKKFITFFEAFRAAI